MIYTRDKGFNQILGDLKEKTRSIKSRQYIGNENLVVLYKTASVNGPISVTPAGRKYRALYVYDTPSEAYTRITFFWVSSPSSPSFTYKEYQYDDYTTMEDREKKAAFIELSVSVTSSLDYMRADVTSSASGTLTITEV